MVTGKKEHIFNTLMPISFAHPVLKEKRFGGKALFYAKEAALWFLSLLFEDALVPDGLYGSVITLLSESKRVPIILCSGGSGGAYSTALKLIGSDFPTAMCVDAEF